MIGQILSATDISASGMAGERMRMEVIANNIANAQTTRGENGQPFRRKNVVFSSAFDAALNSNDVRGMRGVRVVGVEPDQSELPKSYRPGHPDADQDGFVTMPNVEIANEMVDLITASRGYEANLRVMRTFRDMVDRTLDVLRGV
jgi:flagellar basal-body rod protein FlgC